jgi:hypothetical protein
VPLESIEAAAALAAGAPQGQPPTPVAVRNADVRALMGRVGTERSGFVIKADVLHDAPPELVEALAPVAPVLPTEIFRAALKALDVLPAMPAIERTSRDS